MPIENETKTRIQNLEPWTYSRNGAQLKTGPEGIHQLLVL